MKTTNLNRGSQSGSRLDFIQMIIEFSAQLQQYELEGLL